MTTPQPTALPELPEPEAYIFQHEETGNTMFVDRQQVEWGFEENNPRLQKVGKAYTADQMRARDAMWAERLAALQPQPAAAVSDAEIEEIARGKSNHIEFARAILALRPQAVPMTDAVEAERESCFAIAHRYVCQVGDVAWEIAAAIRARGITAQGGEG